MKVTPQELQVRLRWNLNQKIDHFYYVSEAFLSQYPNAISMVSGGIDSVVMDYLLRKRWNTKRAFANTTCEFIEILNYIRDNYPDAFTTLPKMTFADTVKKYGFPLCSKKVARMVHDIRHPSDSNAKSRKCFLEGIRSDGTKATLWVLSKKWHKLIDAPFEVTNKCCDILKKKPLKSLSVDGSFIGTKASDSNMRKNKYMESGCININTKTCTPLGIFDDRDIWTIIKKFNIPYCSLYDQGEKNTGCAACGFFKYEKELKERLLRLKSRTPKRFEYFMELKNSGVTYLEALKYIGINL